MELRLKRMKALEDLGLQQSFRGIIALRLVSHKNRKSMSCVGNEIRRTVKSIQFLLTDQCGSDRPTD